VSLLKHHPPPPCGRYDSSLTRRGEPRQIAPPIPPPLIWRPDRHFPPPRCTIPALAEASFDAQSSPLFFLRSILTAVFSRTYPSEKLVSRAFVFETCLIAAGRTPLLPFFSPYNCVGLLVIQQLPFFHQLVRVLGLSSLLSFLRFSLPFVSASLLPLRRFGCCITSPFVLVQGTFPFDRNPRLSFLTRRFEPWE